MQSGIFLPAGTALSNKTEFFRVPVGILSCTGRNSFVYRLVFFCAPTCILLHAGRDRDIQACRAFLMCGRGDSGLFLYRQHGKEYEFRPWSAGLPGEVGVGLAGIPFRPKEMPNTTANLALLWRKFAVRSLKACPQSESGSGHVFGGYESHPLTK